MRTLSRALPQAQSDQISLASDLERIDSYGDLYVNSLMRREHVLADEGSYFVVNNNQTAITGPAGAAFSATAAALIIQNNNPTSNTVPKRIMPTYIRLEAGGTAFTAASASLGLFFAITLDSTLRYSSGGTNLTPNIFSPNSVALNNSGGQVFAGALVATAASSAVRTIVGQRLLRIAISSTALTLVNVDTFHMNFGGVENMSQTLGSAPALAANSVNASFNLPPIVIGPQCSMLLHIWFNATTPAAGNFLFEVGYVEK